MRAIAVIERRSNWLKAIFFLYLCRCYCYHHCIKTRSKIIIDSSDMNKLHSKWQISTAKKKSAKKQSIPCTLNIVVIKIDYYYGIGAVMQPQMPTLCLTFCLTNGRNREREIEKASGVRVCIDSNQYSWNHWLESHFDWYRYFVHFVSRVVSCRVVPCRIECVCVCAFV